MDISDLKKQVQRICEKVGRNPEEINILAATKGRNINEIKRVCLQGINIIGENRAQELRFKAPYMPPGIRIDFIGHLQTNKIKEVLKYCQLIHSVDNIILAKKIDCEAKKISKIQNILLEINITGETTKYGFQSKEIVDVLPKLLELKNINIQGLMTMAPHYDAIEKSRPIFKNLKKLQHELERKFNIFIPELSMGMSNDFQIAIEEGATIIRLGRIIFQSYK
jgi:PLP dependent protein